ncbi:hypothetical protein BOW53_05815 [Solemya pervernicosa gill symbiont]|uniref:DUF3501 domain-containing protein n=1 Tax=Solemya pervernicosa gill symbiont TaxID=642797 RepID=A0A1T2L7H8_9GAMM|nr:DUF3501 family protein [Solemya pervernicosa gill symbiont]OOZ41033.1 hypothetical protein BOW53_05815 [Solemya pervernicosa gill symbiont]
MSPLTRTDLLSLEQYAEQRNEFRARVMEHKKSRRVAIGEHATLYFEDALTMQYQVQEMLRIERIFEVDAIQDELEVYNPLIPDGSNWKASFMLEYEDEAERRRALTQLLGVERSLYMQVEGFDRVYPVANEDLGRETEDKTAAVHFVRFELSGEVVAAVKQGAAIAAAIEHPAYSASALLSVAERQAIAADVQ